MSESELLSRHQGLLANLSGLPKQMLSLYDLDNVAEFVLHGLCQESCFGLNQAAYFVNNPDFNCLKGVAGFSQEETKEQTNSVLASPESFSEFMRSSNFNKKVRETHKAGIDNSKESYDKAISELAEYVGISNPEYFTWDLKHDNYGVLVYKKSNSENLFDEHFTKSLYLLSFCPIF